MDNQHIAAPVLEMTKRLNELFIEGNEKPKETQEALDQYNNQVRFEAQYLTSSRICSHDGKGSMLGISNADVSGIKEETIISSLRNKFYEYDLMEEVRCMINTILDISDGGESERQRINTYLRGMKRFGAPSAYNYALKGDIKEQNSLRRKKHETHIGNMVVVKCPREPAGSKELIHERVLGDHLNKLRKYIPNFAYVYDAFTCSGTTVNNTTKEVIDFCTSDVSSVAYVMYENVDNAIPIVDLAKRNIDEIEMAKQFFRYLMQGALALNLAESTYGFAHCDLHTDNILLRKYAEKMFAIAYSHLGRLVYVLTPGEIATFIDYGMSHIKAQVDETQNIDLGKLDSSGWFENIGISAKETSTVADVYKLTCFFIRACVAQEKFTAALHISALLGGFFYGMPSISETDVATILKYQWDVRYHIPTSIIKEKGWRIVDFIEYLNLFFRTLYDEDLLLSTVPEGVEVFGCFDSCPMPNQIREELNIHIAEVPTIDVFVENSNNEEVKRRIENNIKTVFQNERFEMSQEINSKHHRGFFVIPTVREEVLGQLSVFIESIQDLNCVAGVVLKLHNRVKKYNYCLDKFGSDEKTKATFNKYFAALIKDATKGYNSNLEYVTRIKDSIKSNYITLQKFIFGKERTTPLSEDEVQRYGTDELYDVYNKYKATVTLFDQAGYTI